MKALKILVIALPILVVLWFVGLFNDKEWIPELHEDYYIGDVGLEQDLSLINIEEQFALQMPWQSDDVKPIDLFIYPTTNSHSLTINRMSARVILQDGSEKEKKYFYVFTSAGELPGIEQVINFPVGLTGTDSVSTYVQVRSVYDLDDVGDFQLQVDADYTYDNNPRTFSKTFDVVHTRKWRWRRLMALGYH